MQKLDQLTRNCYKLHQVSGTRLHLGPDIFSTTIIYIATAFTNKNGYSYTYWFWHISGYWIPLNCRSIPCCC